MLCNHHLYQVPKHSKKTPPYLVSSHSPLLPSPGPCPQPVCVLSLCIRLFWMFPINGIAQCTTLCVWLLSPSVVALSLIHIVACVGASFIFITEGYSVVWLHLLACVHAASSLISGFVLLSVCCLATHPSRPRSEVTSPIPMALC